MPSTPRYSLLLLAFLLVLSTAEDCSCLGIATVRSSYRDNESAVRVTVQRQVKNNGRSDIFADKVYVATVRESYKSCEATTGSALRGAGGAKIEISTGADPALCGVDLDVGREYILFGSYTVSGKNNMPVLRVYNCEYQRPWADLTTEEIEYLEGSGGCYCDGASACGEKLNYTQELCPDGETTVGQTDFCLYDQSQGQCAWEIIECPTCETEYDCKFGQSCSEGGLCTV